jgi:nucleoside-diphosphate-sugar epimerase
LGAACEAKVNAIAAQLAVLPTTKAPPGQIPPEVTQSASTVDVRAAGLWIEGCQAGRRSRVAVRHDRGDGRQGNLNPEVEVIRYVSEGSFQRVLSGTISKAETDLPKLAAERHAIDEAITRRVDTSGDRFAMSVNGTQWSSRADAAIAVRNALAAMHPVGEHGYDKPIHVATLAGFVPPAWRTPLCRNVPRNTSTRMEPDMSVLITGGTGFLGAETARVLVEEGNEKVVLFDLYPNEDAVRGLGDNATIVRGDFSEPVDLINVLTNDVTAIVHLAYVIGEAQTFPNMSIRVNCMGTNMLFEAAMARGIRRVVWASSANVYGGVPTSPSPTWVDEETPCIPNDTMYGAEKYFNELTAELYAKERGFDHVGLRIPSTFGPRRLARRGVPAGFYARFFPNALTGDLTVAPPADTISVWSYYKDVARAFYLALVADRPAHRIYNIPGTAMTHGEAVKLMTELAPKTRVEFGASVRHLAYLNGDRIATDLGFRPNPALRETFAECLTDAASIISAA